MNSRVNGAAVLIVLCCALSTASAEPTLKSVKKQISARLKKITTLQCKVTIAREREFELGGDQYRGDDKTEGALLLERREDKLLARYSKTTIMLEYENKNPEPSRQKWETITITDGAYNWHSVRQDERSWQHMKGKPTIAINLLDPKQRYPKDEFDQKLLPEEEVDGKKAWVIEMARKDTSNKRLPSKTVVWFDQQTGVEIKNVDTYEDGKKRETRTFKDIKIDEKIDPKQFEFTAADKDDVTDMTRF